MQQVKSNKARKKSGKILLEGERLIADALKAGAVAEAIFFSRNELLESLPLENNSTTYFYRVNYNHIQLWSELTTSPGVLGISKENY